jgi:hypothetical protein
MAAGDVNGDGVDEIVIGDCTNYIKIYNQSGGLLHYFWHDFSQFDDLAIGNVTGDAREEIVIGDRDDQILVFDMDGNQLRQFSLSYQQHDGLAVGDVNGVGIDEIVVARQGFDTVWAYNSMGSQVISLAYAFQEGDTLAVGDVLGDAKEEVLIGTDGAIKVFEDKGTEIGPLASRTIYANWRWHDGLAVRKAPGGNEIWWASRLDNLNLMDSHYPQDALQRFDAFTSGADLIAFRGHGNVDGWAPLLGTGGVPSDFGGANPLVLALTCLSGNYQDAWHDKGIAETFLAHGAGVYIGSTQVSAGSTNSSATDRFLATWDASETVGKSLWDVEYDRWGKGDLDWWEFWVSEYNLYGDPKFGDPSAVGAASASAAMTAQQTPPTTLTVTVPDYVVTPRGDGYVDVDIPGGELIQQRDEYRIPYWSVSIDYPQGQRVQDVILTDRSGLEITSGLPITTVQMNIACPAPTCPQRQESSIEGQDGSPDDDWTPNLQRVYEWSVLDNPDGSSVLVIEMFPFYYQPLTQQAQFYKQFAFDIETTTSTVAIDLLALDKVAYDPGEGVSITLSLNSTESPQDVLVETTVRDRSSGEVVDGLALRNLHDLSGDASYALAWDSSGFETGNYYVEVALRDSEDNVLDRATKDFRLGIISGEITSLTATPSPFKVGDTVHTSLVFRNTGSVPLTGTAFIEVQTADGQTSVATFTHAVENLAPDSTVNLDDAWDTSGATEDAYQVTGYVLYESRSTAVESVNLSTRANVRVYLPMVLRNH